MVAIQRLYSLFLVVHLVDWPGFFANEFTDSCLMYSNPEP